MQSAEANATEDTNTHFNASPGKHEEKIKIRSFIRVYNRLRNYNMMI